MNSRALRYLACQVIKKVLRNAVKAGIESAASRLLH